jgi:hypothetical protein
VKQRAKRLISEPPLDEWATDQTLELCGIDQNGCRCMLNKKHAGPHEALTLSGVTKWE